MTDHENLRLIDLSNKDIEYLLQIISFYQSFVEDSEFDALKNLKETLLDSVVPVFVKGSDFMERFR